MERTGSTPSKPQPFLYYWNSPWQFVGEALGTVALFAMFGAAVFLIWGFFG